MTMTVTMHIHIHIRIRIRINMHIHKYVYICMYAVPCDIVGSTKSKRNACLVSVGVMAWRSCVCIRRHVSMIYIELIRLTIISSQPRGPRGPVDNPNVTLMC